MTGPDVSRVARDWAKELPGLDISVFQLSSLLTRLGTLMELEFARVARERELRPGDLRVLLALARSGPEYALSPVRLVRELMVTSGGVSKQIDSLEGRGLVQRVPEFEGSRGLVVRLQPEGRQLALEAMRSICATFGRLEDLDGRFTAGLIDELQGLYEHVTGHEPESRGPAA